MSRILITHSYFYKFDAKQWETKQPYPPLGTLYAAAVLRESGCDIAVFDTNLAASPAAILPVLEKERPAYLVVYDDNFNYLTKMCLVKMREAAFELTKYGKAAGCTVIVSSSDATDQYQRYLDAGVDYVVLGEGEATLRELVGALELSDGLRVRIDGTVFSDHGQTVRMPRRELLTELDELPFPAWDLVDIEAYRTIWMAHHGYFSLNIATTRGCPFKCNWCAKPIFGNRFHSRSPKNVVDELERLIRDYRVDAFWFCDDIFGLKPGWVDEFRDLVRARHLRFRYKIQARVDLLLNDNIIDALSESGADTIWVGAESGSQQILDAMEKGTTVAQIYEATARLKQKHINVAFFIQLGYLGETKEDIAKTIRMITDLQPDDIGISVSYPLPGTKFYETVKSGMQEKTNWDDSNDLAMMFRNTFPAGYYKRLHHYIHGVYRFSRSMRFWRSFLGDPFSQHIGALRTALHGLSYLPRIAIDKYMLRKLEGSIS